MTQENNKNNQKRTAGWWIFYYDMMRYFEQLTFWLLITQKTAEISWSSFCHWTFYWFKDQHPQLWPSLSKTRCLIFFFFNVSESSQIKQCYYCCVRTTEGSVSLGKFFLIIFHIFAKQSDCCCKSDRWQYVNSAESLKVHCFSQQGAVVMMRTGQEANMMTTGTSWVDSSPTKSVNQKCWSTPF